MPRLPDIREHRCQIRRKGTGPIHLVERDWHLMGGLAIERHTIDSRTYALETSFAPNGAPLDQKLPGTPGATTTGWIGPVSYDAAGRVTGFTGFITSVTYNACSFVSVTQAFNTATSMGRLTRYAETFGGKYRRIEAVAKIGDKFRVLDLTEPGTRAAVATATTIKALYESEAAADYLA